MRKTDHNGLTMSGRLEFIRRLLTFTRKEWAEKLGLNVSLIANIELERQKPSSHFLEVLSEHYPHLIEYVVTGKIKHNLDKEQKAFVRKLGSYKQEEIREILNSKINQRF